MDKKTMFLVFGVLAVLVLATAVIEAAATYRMPSKYKGLAKSVDKKDLFKPKMGPCQKLFPKKCSAWDTVVGDKTTAKAYNCLCRVQSDLKEDKVVCFTSTTSAKKAKPGYRVENCRR